MCSKVLMQIVERKSVVGTWSPSWEIDFYRGANKLSHSALRDFCVHGRDSWRFVSGLETRYTVHHWLVLYAPNTPKSKASRDARLLETVRVPLNFPSSEDWPSGNPQKAESRFQNDNNVTNPSLPGVPVLGEASRITSQSFILSSSYPFVLISCFRSTLTADFPPYLPHKYTRPSNLAATDCIRNSRGRFCAYPSGLLQLVKNNGEQYLHSRTQRSVQGLIPKPSKINNHSFLPSNHTYIYLRE